MNSHQRRKTWRKEWLDILHGRNGGKSISNLLKLTILRMDFEEKKKFVELAFERAGKKTTETSNESLLQNMSMRDYQLVSLIVDSTGVILGVQPLAEAVVLFYITKGASAKSKQPKLLSGVTRTYSQGVGGSV